MITETQKIRTYHNFSHLIQKPAADLASMCEPGDYVWTGFMWMQRGKHGFTAVHPSRYDAQQRLCSKCRRPLIFRTYQTVGLLQQMVDSIRWQREREMIRDYDMTVEAMR